MPVEPPRLPAEPIEKPRTSGLAIASVVLGVLSCPAPLLASIPGLVCGIIGLRRISRSEQSTSGKRLTGRGLAICGIILCSMTTLLTPILVALLLPAVQAARNAARDQGVRLNLTQISLAAAQIQNEVGFFPGDIISRDGRALLSWRVAILPTLGPEEAKLYAEFHLDEPWDSAHNKSLIPRMPAVFASPDEAPADGVTDFVHPVGEGSAFSTADGALSLDEGKTVGLSGVKPDTVRDGLSYTVFVARVPGFQTPWTLPGDFAGDPVELFANLQNAGVRTVVIGMGDGTTRRTSTSTAPAVIRAIFSRDGGEILQEGSF